MSSVCTAADSAADSAVASAKPPASTARSRNAAVDVLKGLAIVGVVLHHVENPRFDATTLDYLRMLRHAVCWSVLAFLMVAGYLQGKSRRTISKRDLIVARARRLLGPYVILAIVYAIIRALIEALSRGTHLKLNHDYQFSLGTLVKSIVTVDSNLIGPQLYFFPLLLIVSGVLILFPGAMSDRRRNQAILAISTLGATAVLLLRGTASTGFSWEMIVLGVAQFTLGFYAAKYPDDRVWPWVFTALMAVVAISTGRVTAWAMTAPWPLFALCQLAPAPRPLVYLGEASGTIFAYHTPFILQPILVGFWIAGWHSFLGVMAAVAVTLAICCLLHAAISRSPRLAWMRI